MQARASQRARRVRYDARHGVAHAMPFRWRWLAPCLCGCSLFVPKLEAPTLSVVNVELLKSDLWEQR